jgi:hypothetical protein
MKCRKCSRPAKSPALGLCEAHLYAETMGAAAYERQTSLAETERAEAKARRKAPKVRPS